MISSIISRVVILVFGTLYPAYASYKAVRTKNLKEYVKWMMYWIVFALFTCTETFTDVFLSWFPFYYEVKIVLVLWLLSPATKGSSILYRKFVHPALCRREQEIDEYIAKAKDQGYHTVLNLGTKGVNYATTVIMQTAIKGGGGLVQQIRKSYSLSDLTECAPRDERAEAEDVLAEQVVRRTVVRSGYNTRRSASESNSRSPIYFPEVDVDIRSGRTKVDEPDYSHIKSSEDISSGYSSADNSGTSLTRTASVGAGGARVRARQSTRTQLTTIKRPQPAEDSEVIIEDLREDDSFDYTSMPPLMNVPSPLFLSHTDPPFIYQYDGDQVRIIQILGEPLNATDHMRNYDVRVNKESLNEPTELIRGNACHSADIVQVDDKNDKVENIGTDELFFESTDKLCHVKPVDPAINKNLPQETIKTVNVKDVELPKIENPNIPKVIDKSEKDVEFPVDSVIDPIPKTMTESTNISIELSKDDNRDTTSLEALNEDETVDSDDEASFGTPDNSPKTKRKSIKGRYGKGKAPPPPKTDCNNNDGKVTDTNTNIDTTSLTTSQESLVDIINSLPNVALKDVGASSSLTVNPIAEKKRRHKSKSPNRIPKGTAIGKLLQLPSKLAFWHKNDKGKGDDASISSGERSRRSSEKFDDCNEINTAFTVLDDGPIIEDVGKADDQISFKDASDFESEVTAHDIMEKSDALQKLIEAKIESHPEYKYSTNTVEAEIKTLSKSTDV